MNAVHHEPPTRTKRKTNRISIPFGEHTRFKNKYFTFDSHRATNAHMLFAGPSGTGKSHQLNRVILALAEQGARVHLIDIHGDLGDFSDIAPHREKPIPDNLVHSIKFGEQSPFGLAPLDLLPGPEGGPRKCATDFIDLLQRQGALGPKQKTALFRLLMDLYKQHGFLQDDPRTWSLDFDPRRVRVAKQVTPRPGMLALPNLDWYDKNDFQKKVIRDTYDVKFNAEGPIKFWEVSQDHPNAAEAVANWGPVEGKRYPTLSDVRRHLWDRLVMMKTGQSAPTIRALDKVMTLAKSRAKLCLRKQNESGQEDLDKLDEMLLKAQTESIDAFSEGIKRVDSGMELEELLLWDSADAVKGLFDRVEALEASGMFKSKPPKFDENVPVHRYDISSPRDAEQALFVEVLLERLFANAKLRGEADGPDTFILLDEAVKFVSAESHHIINRIVNEARKYGVSIILAAQAFVHYSDDLMISSGLKIVLGCPITLLEQMRKKLGMDMVVLDGGKRINPLSFIKPKQTALISITIDGETSPMSNINIVAA